MNWRFMKLGAGIEEINRLEGLVREEDRVRYILVAPIEYNGTPGLGGYINMYTPTKEGGMKKLFPNYGLRRENGHLAENIEYIERKKEGGIEFGKIMCHYCIGVLKHRGNPSKKMKTLLENGEESGRDRRQTEETESREDYLKRTSKEKEEKKDEEGGETLLSE